MEWATLDLKNIHERNMGIHLSHAPHTYKSNELISATSLGYSGTVASFEGLNSAIENLTCSLQWILSCLAIASITSQNHDERYRSGLAVRMALLLRRLGAADIEWSFLILRELCAHLELPYPHDVDEFLAGLDKIDAAIEALLPPDWRGKPLTPVSQLPNLKRPSTAFEQLE